MPDDPGPGSPERIIVFIGLICLAALFGAAEYAFSSLSKKRVSESATIKNVNVMEKLLANHQRLAISLQGGAKISQLAAALVISDVVLLFGNKALALGLLTLFLSVAFIIFCEKAPRVFCKSPIAAAAALALPVRLWVFVFAPFSWAISIVSALFSDIRGTEAVHKITEDEILTVVNKGQEEGVLESGEREMISNVISFGDYRAKDVMVPRPDMATVDVEASYKEIVALFKEEGFSRLPVYEDTPDTIVGILYLRDMAFVREDEFDIRRIMRKPFFTYELKPTINLFSTMRERAVSMAIVLDEYGGTAGLVTIQDFIEEIVGDISDEYDEIEMEIEKIHDNEYLAEGSTRLDTVNDVLGLKLESQDFDSIGGFVIGMLGHIPKEGEEAEHEKIRFRVEALDKNRIEKIRIYI